MTIISLLDLVGTFAFAISGIRIAAKKDMDIFGATVIGFVTAIGGGSLRDMMIGLHPITWVTDITYPLVILAAVFFTYLIRNRFSDITKPLFLFDTIGLAMFTISGMEKALSAGLTPLTAGIMGMISAVVGGIIRDVLCSEVPLIFRKEIYATACLAGAIIFYLGIVSGIDTNINYLITTSVIVAIRILSIRFHLSLPKMRA